MTNTVDSTPLWKPNPATVGDTRMAQFIQATGHGSYANLWQWSVDQPGAFWATVEILRRPRRARWHGLAEGERTPGARWFPEARPNYAENLLHHRDDGDALVFWGETKVKRRLSRAQLAADVARFAAFPRPPASAWGPGGGFCPTCRKLWSPCSPQRRWAPSGRRPCRIFGVQGVLDRFGQIEPRC